MTIECLGLQGNLSRVHFSKAFAARKDGDEKACCID